MKKILIKKFNQQILDLKPYKKNPELKFYLDNYLNKEFLDRKIKSWIKS